MHIAPPQENYSEALPVQPRWKRSWYSFNNYSHFWLYHVLV